MKNIQQSKSNNYFNQTATHNKQPKVSIVVPIYGVERYLNQCVDSILAQTLKDIEIILVDDGSKDRCPEIVDEYAKKDSRIIAIHQPNGGYGRAVNHGISVATGDYIGIIESDDWIEPTMYEKLYNAAQKFNADITKCEFFRYNSLAPLDKQNIIWKARYQDLSEAPDGAFNVTEWPLIIAFHASIWSNLYKASFIKKQQVIESRSASYQDFPFMIEAMCRAKKITVVKEPLVHYRMEEGQNSSTIRRDERLILMPKQCNECKQILKKYKLYNNLKEEFYFHAYLACIGFYKTIYWKFKREFYKEFHQVFKELSKDESFKFKYFSPNDINTVKTIIHGHFLRSFLTLSMIRHFLISIHIHQGFLIQCLGIQIYNKEIANRPALIKIKL